MEAGRKIIQVVTTSGVGTSVDPWLMTFALCDDGSLWSMGHWHGETKGTWVKEKDIPQDVTKPDHIADLKKDVEILLAKLATIAAKEIL